MQHRRLAPFALAVLLSLGPIFIVMALMTLRLWELGVQVLNQDITEAEAALIRPNFAPLDGDSISDATVARAKAMRRRRLK